jgi:hypothetical protein
MPDNVYCPVCVYGAFLMPLDVTKQTYMEADEKTWRGLTYDLFDTLTKHFDELQLSDRDQAKECLRVRDGCDGRFRRMELKLAAWGGGLAILVFGVPIIIYKIL